MKAKGPGGYRWHYGARVLRHYAVLNQDSKRTGAILYELQSVERSKVQKGYTYGYHTTVPQVRDFASI